jgi:hypothetical protein
VSASRRLCPTINRVVEELFVLVLDVWDVECVDIKLFVRGRAVVRLSSIEVPNPEHRYLISGHRWVAATNSKLTKIMVTGRAPTATGRRR